MKRMTIALFVISALLVYTQDKKLVYNSSWVVWKHYNLISTEIIGNQLEIIFLITYDPNWWEDYNAYGKYTQTEPDQFRLIKDIYTVANNQIVFVERIFGDYKPPEKKIVTKEEEYIWEDNN